MQILHQSLAGPSAYATHPGGAGLDRRKSVAPVTYLLCLGFFFHGLHIEALYIPIISVYALFTVERVRRVRLSKWYFTLTALLVLFAFWTLVFGADHLTVNNPSRRLASLLFSIGLAGFVFYLQRPRVQVLLIGCFVLGMATEAVAAAAYNHFLGTGRVGYGMLLNPLSGDEINSPALSNNLTLGFALIAAALGRVANIVKKIALGVIGLLFFAVGLYLGGRAFFVICVVAVAVVLGKSGNLVKALGLIAVLGLGGGLLYWLLSNTRELLTYFEFTLGRFESLGLDSPRWSMLGDGFEMMLTHPFGGFDAWSIGVGYDGEWFHNVFIDAARAAGWPPVILLCGAIAYTISSAMRAKGDAWSWDFGFMLFLTSVLVMQQDVVLEGNYRPLISMYLAAVLMFSSTGRSCMARRHRKW